MTSCALALVAGIFGGDAYLPRSVRSEAVNTDDLRALIRNIGRRVREAAGFLCFLAPGADAFAVVKHGAVEFHG
jgi:hypothetical protein